MATGDNPHSSSSGSTDSVHGILRQSEVREKPVAMPMRNVDGSPIRDAEEKSEWRLYLAVLTLFPALLVDGLLGKVRRMVRRGRY